MFKLKYMIHEEETIMKKSMKAILLAAMTVTALAGCSSKPADPTTAVYMAEPVADAVAVTCTALLFAWQFRRAMRRLEKC